MRHISLPPIVAFVAAARGLLFPAVGAQPNDERTGLRCVSKGEFPLPPQSEILLFCDFEMGDGKLPAGWSLGNAEIVSARTGGGDRAPQGQAYFRIKAKKNAGLRSPVAEVRPGTPCFLSYWIKTSTDPWTTITFTSDEREPSFTIIHSPIFYDDFPLDTRGEWRQEGFYFVAPPQCHSVQFNISGREDGPDGQFVCLDEVRLRTAAESEVAAAYVAERAHFPPEDVTPRASDGRNLALSVAKWEGRAGMPGRPFVIWALGSSFTDRQGDGQELVRAIRERFPAAPPIIYRKHGGPGTPWEYVHGWVRQFIAAEQPDLIFTYTSGTMEGLDNLLTEIRRRTTADVIVPTLHFKPDSTMTSDDIEHGAGVDWGKAREICERHHVEFVENRREMADYIAREGLVPDDLLSDHNHQNMHGRIRIWDHVARHLAKADATAETPDARERWISVAAATASRPGATPSSAKEHLEASGQWINAGGALSSHAAGDRLRVNFTGNRIDLNGRRMPGGGTVQVLMDGVPGETSPHFVMDYIQPSKRSLWRIPHAVELGAHPTPQAWTITMTSDTGDYRLEGSVTGADGTGNLARMFTGPSGQVGIDPKFWRAGHVEARGGNMTEYGVSTGDAFRFDVLRGTIGELSFSAEQSARFAEPLARDLPNGEHTVVLVTKGDGEVVIEGVYIYEPPEP